MKIKSLIIGGVIGDCLGVPVEFETRHVLKRDPVVDIKGFGTHHQLPGTWSDDTSMSYALAESILEGYDFFKLTNKFVDWYTKGLYTSSGKVFDIGITTSNALKRYMMIKHKNCGGNSELENGNGSLMRISPLILLLKDLDINSRFELVKEVSSITHAHIRSVLSCFYFCELMLEIYKGVDRFDAYNNVSETFYSFMNEKNISQIEKSNFDRLINDNIWEYPENEIKSTGYVIHTLEASLWSFYNNNNFIDSVLTAVNLGDDTDTTGTVCGSISGLFFGFDSIPTEWINKVIKGNELLELSDKLEHKFK